MRICTQNYTYIQYTPTNWQSLFHILFYAHMRTAYHIEIVVSLFIIYTWEGSGYMRICAQNYTYTTRTNQLVVLSYFIPCAYAHRQDNGSRATFRLSEKKREWRECTYVYVAGWRQKLKVSFRCLRWCLESPLMWHLRAKKYLSQNHSSRWAD